LQKVASSTLTNGGSIKINVNSDKPFTVTLLELRGIEESTVKTEPRNSTSEVLFTNLNADAYYKIVVDFANEEKFLCKQKIFTNIRLTDKK
jgi:hypothetical protein